MNQEGKSILAIGIALGNVIKNSLFKEGFSEYTLITACSGKEGLKIAAEAKPDIALLGSGLPDMDGYEVCRRFKADKFLKDIPIVFVVHEEPVLQNRINALESGAEALLAWPIDTGELAALMRAMEKRRAANAEKRDEIQRLSGLVQEHTRDLSEANQQIEKLHEALEQESKKRENHKETMNEVQQLARIGSFEYDVVHKKFSCSNEALRICGIEADKFDGDPEKIINLAHPEDRRAIMKTSQKASAARRNTQYTCRLIRKDGDVRIVQVRFGPVFDEKGKLVKSIGTIQDITEHKKVEEALIESELRFRTLAENELTGVYIIQGQKHVYVNPAYCAIVGYTPEEIYKANLFDTIHPDDVQLAKANVERKLGEKNLSTHYTIRRRHKNGEYRTLEIISVGIIYNNQPAIVGNIIDITERIQAENKLIDSEKRYRTLSENALIGICIIDEEGKRIFSNAVYNEIMGFTSQEALDMDIYANIHPDDLKKVKKSVRDKLSGKKEITRYEYRRRRKDGEYRTIETYAKRVMIDGRSTIINSVVDVTERKRQEEALVDSEEKFSKAFHTAPYSITITRAKDGRFLDVNEAFVSTFGYTREEALSGSITALNIWVDIQERNKTVQEVEKGHVVYNQEYRLRKKNGDIVTCLLSAQTIHLDTEPVILTSTMDITNRKHAEEALRREQGMAKLYLETVNVMVVVLDENDRVTLINNKGCEILGLEHEDIIGTNWIENYIPQARKADVTQVFKKVVSGDLGIVEFYENPVINADGEERLISWHNATLLDEEGKVSSLLSAGMDITERKQAEDKLKKSEELHSLLISQMLAGLAVHEIILNEKGKPVDYRFLEVNESFERLTGLKGTDIIGKTVLEVLPATEDYWIENYGRVALTGEPLRYENYSREFGKYYEVAAYQTQYKQFAVIITDVTERRMAEETIKQSEAKFRTYTQMAPLGIFIVDKQGRYIEVNRAACEMTGYTEAELLRISIPDFLAPESLNRGGELFNQVVREGYASGEIIGRKKNGEKYWVDLFSVKVSDERYMAFCLDISNRKRNEARILYLVDHDHLTGLFNRRYFEEKLEALDTDENLPISIVMGDVNGLKLINDSFGHATGDEILKKAAQAIQTACRVTDIAARTGGDEFIVLMPKTGEKEANEIIMQIQDTARNEKAGSVSLSISLGLKIKNDREQSMQEILVEAENEMYRHKLYESSSMRSKTITVVMNTLFEKSSREMMHSKRVSEICEAIASQMNFDKEGIERMRLAGLLHDIGKIGVDESILNKPRRLNKKEWEEIQKHPEAGWRILNAASEFSELATFILEHHERWDGNGYPNGLMGERISMGARIIAVADAYDAMTSVRAYGKKLNVEEAREEIKRCSGTQFDPAIVETFIDKVAGKIQ